MPAHAEEPPDGVFDAVRSVNKRIPTIDHVTDEDIGFYREYGYLVIDQFLSDEAIEAAKEAILERLDQGSVDFWDERALELDGLTPEDIKDAPPETKLDYFNVFLDFSDQRLRAPGEREDLRSLVERLLGSEPHPRQTMAMTKVPGGTAKEWHQDSALLKFEPGPGHVIGAWIALDEATADNGAMHIVPGSHREGPITHQWDREFQICDTDVMTDEVAVVPLEPGGMLLWDGMTHHGTPPNTTDRHRRALQFHYHDGDVEQRNEEGVEEFGTDVKTDHVQC